MIQLPRYAISEKIHETNHAIFFRGHREADRFPIAVKCLKSEYPTLTELAKLRHEHAVLEALDVPGVVKVVALERYGNGLALVTEDFGGASLDRTLRSRRLALRDVLDLGCQLADTLASLHRHQVIHKDVKPHNILVNFDTGKVALIDFGVATRLSHETQRARGVAALEGTLAYMSPEQTGRMNRVVDHRSDLYSLGVTLYEMLTGKVPFQSSDPMDLVHSHIARRPTPPNEVSPDVPQVVCSIVMRLLAKPAEERYQHATGLHADLQTCLARLDEHGQIEPFELGLQDLSAELRIPQKLYGRDEEILALTKAFERAASGKAELLLVAGYAGVGKSVLVNEIHKALAHRRGHFLSGKFDQLSRSVPFAPVAHAFRDLFRHILAEPDVARDRWKAALLGALGTNAQVIIDLIPELEQLLGPQPAVQALGPTESQNRFALVFQNFLRVFSTADHPLVLFLDDLQWADPASLKLLQLLLTDPESGHLLLIGAYRDNEVDAAHPLTLGLEEIKKTGATVSSITLKPLDAVHVGQLVADAVVCDRARAAKLAEIIYDRTQGNPFFITQLLGTMHRDGLLRFDASIGAWTWDPATIRSALVTDNIVDFMVARMKRLDPRTRRVLELAACIGHQFRLRTLSTICQASESSVAGALWPALREGLVLPLDAEYRFVHAGGDTGAGDFDVSYRFLHDRAQQAAYSLIAEVERQDIHLRIGRLLEKSGTDDDLFEVVNHMNVGAGRITDTAERLGLAKKNLVAGRRAKAATAYEAAAGYFEAGMALLCASSWETEYDLTFALHRQRAECEYLARRAETAEALFETLLTHARTRLERANIHDLHINLYTTLGHIAEAQKLGRKALALFDIELPETEEARQAAFGAELALVPQNLAGRSIEDLATAPELVDPEQQAVQTLFSSLFPSSFLTSPLLYGFVIIRHVNLSLKYGQSPASAMGYMSYGYLISGVLGQYDDARRFGELALKLNDRFANANMRAMLHFLFGVYSHFFLKADEALGHLTRSRQAGFEVGDFQYLSYTTYLTFVVKIGRGDPLPAVHSEIDSFLAIMQRTKDQLSTLFLTVSKQVLLNLEGKTRSRLDLSDDNFDEAGFAKMLGDIGLVFVACFMDTYKAQICFLRGEFTRALEYTRAALKNVGSAAGLYFTTELEFYACLILTELYPTASAEDKEKYLAELAGYQKRITTWAEHCPSTFEHKRLLVEAELTRIRGREVEAMNLYDEAIEAARAVEWVRDEAVANELCARFHESQGRTKVARAYMTDAYYGYLRWGVPSKVADMEAAHRYLVEQSSGTGGISLSATSSTMTRAVGSSVLDVATMLKAAQALSGELVLDKLLERLLRLVIENAGAQRGMLLLSRDGQLRLEARMSVEPDEVRVGLDIPAGSAPDLPQSVLQHVLRKHEPLVLGNAARHEVFGGDPHIAQNRVSSLACLPMLHQGRLAGVLYLENNIALDAFTPARNELLQALSSQAAISIVNALLYTDLRSATEQLRRTNETLEQQVASRTQELSRAMADLWSEMDVARKIQTVLLPQDPALTGYQITAVMQPAAHVGGDYYDVFRAGGREWLLVGDVSGHGVPAGLIMMMVQTAVRSTVLALGEGKEQLTPSRLLAKANETLRTNLEKLGTDQYMTISAFNFEGGKVRYSGLHEDIHVYRAAKRVVERIETRGVWLGILDNIGPLLHDDEFQLEPGDVLLLITDGVTEARRNGEMFGQARLANLFQSAAVSAEGRTEPVIEALLGGLEPYTLADDVTMLAIRREEQGPKPS